MDNQDDKVLSGKEQAKDVAKTFVGMLNYNNEAYDPDLTLDEFEAYYKNQYKKAKEENKKEIEELINLVSILKKQQEIVDKEMKLGDFNVAATNSKGGKGAKTQEEVTHQVKKVKEQVEEAEYEEEKKKKKKKEKKLKEQADFEIQNLQNEQERTINNQDD